jgi:pSer/pThr/pTyr-binding forkhead associated (FHA) protein
MVLEPFPPSPDELRDRAVAERRGVAFLLYRGAGGDQVLLELSDDRDRLTIGRRAGNDVALPWDAEVSRVHAELSRMGADWVVRDDGISHNGTFVNGQRVRGRRLLHGGDAISIGATLVAFCAPSSRSTVSTATAGECEPAPPVTPAQRRVLAALCRPLGRAGYAAPATNRQIASELVISVETVKGTMGALFERFGIRELPQSQKRAALAARGLDVLSGADQR